MTNRPRLYPGHQHEWADVWPDMSGLIASDMVRCTVCGLQMPRNAAGLDGRMTCPGCGQPITPRYQPFGICRNCYGTTDDPEREARA